MKTISCNVCRDILPLYVDGVVSEETKELIEAHLEGCEGCRAESEKMSRTLMLPVEKDTHPLKSIEKQWTKQNTLICGLSLALVTVFILMIFPLFDASALTVFPIFDTAMKSNIHAFIYEDSGLTALVLLLTTSASFGLEFWFINLKRRRWPSIAMLVAPAIILLLSELSWAGGSWGDQLLGSLLWVIGFPLITGAVLAVLLKAALKQPLWAKLCIILILCILLSLIIILWPKNADILMTVEPDKQMLAVFDGGRVVDGGRKEQIEGDAEMLANLIKGCKLTHCEYAPPWGEYDCILIRINGNYVLSANSYAPASYIYEYDGPLDRFAGQNLRYSIENGGQLYNVLYHNYIESAN